MTLQDEQENEDLKSLAEDLLVKSIEEVSDDKEIIKRINGKIIFIKENDGIKVIYNTKNLQEKIGLYLIAKFVGSKILNKFKDSLADSSEISSALNVSIQALAPSLGALSKEFIDKVNEKYRIKAYKILDFLEELEKQKNRTESPIKSSKKSSKKDVDALKLVPMEDGLKELASILGKSESSLRGIFFMRENDLKIIDTKFIKTQSMKEIQLQMSLAYLLAYKYLFNVEKVPASTLRKKLQLMGIKSLVNLTTNLHKFPEFIIHDAGKKGSINNNFMLTHPGEEMISRLIINYIEEKENES